MEKSLKLITVVLSIFIASLSYALDVSTHRAINEAIAQNTLNGFSLDSYLKNQLGIQAGINEEFNTNGNSQEIWKWLRIGGYYEDKPPRTLPYRRSVNHFHNPLNPLNQAGFTGIWDIGVFLPGNSAALWSQSPIGTQSPGGFYSWHDVRDYFYKALTSLDQTTRNTNFTSTFRGLGQLMHLVQDMSVPEHARDDGHYTYAYEEWVKDTQSSSDLQRRAIFDTALANPVFFDMAALSQPSAFGTDAPIPIANLFDTKQYKGTNPSVTMNQNIGLSEYSNANFVSADTLFTNFPYPSKTTSVVTQDYSIPDPIFIGQTVSRQYYQKTADGDSGYRLAGVGYLNLYLEANDPLKLYAIIPPMDGNVYSDYAQRLLPRAIGYSAGLLNYFFRGQIDMEPDPENAGKYIIKNLSNENMSGEFNLYYDSINDDRLLVASWELTVNANDKSSPVTFIKPTDPSPKEDGAYFLVFRGTLGNESGAVAGKIVKVSKIIKGTGTIYLNTSTFTIPEDNRNIEEMVSRACSCPGRSWVNMDPASYWTIMLAAGGDYDWWAIYQSSSDESTSFILEREDATYKTQVQPVNIYDEELPNYNPAAYGCALDMGFYCDVDLYIIVGGTYHALSASLTIDDSISASSVEITGKQSGVHVILSDRYVLKNQWGASYTVYRTPTTRPIPMDPNAPSWYGRMMDLDSRSYPLIPNEDFIVKIGEDEYDTSDPDVKNSLTFSWQVYQ